MGGVKQCYLQLHIQYNTIQDKKQFILCRISDKIVAQRCVCTQAL